MVHKELRAPQTKRQSLGNDGQPDPEGSPETSQDRKAASQAPQTLIRGLVPLDLKKFLLPLIPQHFSGALVSPAQAPPREILQRVLAHSAVTREVAKCPSVIESILLLAG